MSMTAFALPFLPGIISFIAFAVILPFAMRVPWPSSPALRLLPAAGIIFPAGLVVGWHWFGVFEPWPSAAIFGLLFMLLWFVFGSVAKSVTLLVSCRLLDFPEGVAAAAIKRDVIESEFDIRAALLCDMGYVDRRNATYVIAPAGLRFLGKLRKASSFFGIESKGLYGLDR